MGPKGECLQVDICMTYSLALIRMTSRSCLCGVDLMDVLGAIIQALCSHAWSLLFLRIGGSACAHMHAGPGC